MISTHRIIKRRIFKMKYLFLSVGFVAVPFMLSLIREYGDFDVRILKSRVFKSSESPYYIGYPKRLTQAVDCKAIFEGDVEEKLKAKRSKHKFLLTNEEVAKLAQNCSALRMKYIMRPVSEREESFPIAFSILMYKDVAQVEFLLRTIYRPQNVYCIHVDKDAALNVTGAMRNITNCFQNVFIVSKPVAIVYAGFSRLQADINCMKDLLQSNRTWKYFINTSGQMFPLKSNEEMVRILEIYNGANDIEYAGYGSAYRPRYEYRHVENNKELVITGAKNPPMPLGLHFVKGSAYGLFSRDFVRYFFEESKVKIFLEWAKNTYSPDEFVWSSIHHTGLNKQFQTPGGNNASDYHRHDWLATHAAWCGAGGESNLCFSHKCVHSICIPGVEDLQRLAKRREFTVNKLFARFQPATTVCLAERLWNKTFTPLNDTDLDFYRNLSFIIPKGNHAKD